MSATLSPCRTYRYRLDREVDLLGDKVIAYFGVNPSTADESVDDATVRKWRGFSQRLQASRFIVGNVFAYRATDVNHLAKVDDPVGPITRSIFMLSLTKPICWYRAGEAGIRYPTGYG